MYTITENQFNAIKSSLDPNNFSNMALILEIQNQKEKEDQGDLHKLLCDIKTLLLDVDTPTREQRSDIVHRIASVSGLKQREDIV